MGHFDILIDEENVVQVKLWNYRNGFMLKIKKGQFVPKLENMKLIDYTIATYGDTKYAIIKNRRFIKLTDDVKETTSPYITKWGKLMSKEEVEEYEIEFNEF